MMKKYKSLKIPREVFYSTWQGISKYQAEWYLNLMEQGYRDQVMQGLVHIHMGVAQGIFEVFEHILEEEEIKTESIEY